MEFGSQAVCNDEEDAANCFDGDKENHDHGEEDLRNLNGNSNGKEQEGYAMKENENNELCPSIGMEFESQEEAYVFYNRYAIEMGFSARKSSTRKSQRTGEIIGRCFCCSLQGYRNASSVRVVERKRLRPESRTGCKAMMSIRRKKGGRWVVSQVVKEHNHALTSPSKRHKLRSRRKIIEWEVLENMRSEGVGTNLIMNFMALEAMGNCNVGFTIRETKNFLSTRRQRELRKGDVATILDYLERQQINNPSFFSSIQLDSNGQMTNFFWADARSRMDYYYFGDIVCIDPTYGTDKYSIPFVPIMGVNHHCQTILFGSALLFDETEESFAWVLATLMRAMGGQQPKVILTDQISAIGGAVARVMPGTRHCFCLWNIMQNATKYIPHAFSTRNGFTRDFTSCLLYQGDTVEEFESIWKEMIERYNLRGNPWAMKLYGNREKWASVYVRDVFCGPMYTTQFGESIHAYFDGYMKRHMPLYEFVKQHDRAVLARRQAENDEDFETNQKMPTLRVGMNIEEEAAQIYTREILQKFQDELIQALNYHHEKMDEDQTKFTYSVWKKEYEQTRHIVTFDSSNNNANCSCHLFEFTGYLCRHILKIFVVIDVQNLPCQYILKRWTRDAKFGPVVDDQAQAIQGHCRDPVSLRYFFLYRLATNIAAKAAANNEVYRVAMNGLHTSLKEVEGTLKRLSIGSVEHIKEFESTHGDNISHESPGNCLAEQGPLLDPPNVKHKGRPGRKKASLDNQLNRKITPNDNIQVSELSMQSFGVIGGESGIQQPQAKVGQSVETSLLGTSDQPEDSIRTTNVMNCHQTRNLVNPYMIQSGGSHTYSPCTTTNLELDQSSQGFNVAGVQHSPLVMESSVAGQQRQQLIISRHDDIACNGFYPQQHSGASFVGHHPFGQRTAPAFVLNPHQLHGIMNIDLNDPSQKGDGRSM
ncbi:PREDICTED: protein FAR1-RELATED SEQUENCE 5-like isoform X2 [Nelumbo nucifera]|uniref:Protein FAR1-RELATED SEQUENCE n=2 Tax=Nelumbo nucifera TaxID=4432 RepID=A0A1U7ZBL8_NELNU|nr:PREDICTED: protein FAR1-RELATED SEQUENCE 5-like isoform X2 [Nelumbo nucifera]DAD17867.1 TPA_asm: hypothetical protein HUJ06_019330 [Nelumbo nucifera]